MRTFTRLERIGNYNEYSLLYFGITILQDVYEYEHRFFPYPPLPHPPSHVYLTLLQSVLILQRSCPSLCYILALEAVFTVRRFAHSRFFRYSAQKPAKLRNSEAVPPLTTFVTLSL